MKLSIVTVSMNRNDQIIRTATEVAKLDLHLEHIILDYGSTTPIKRDDLPKDSRVKLHRAESSNGKWWLTHSYNLAFALAEGDYILKLDADIILKQVFADELLKQLEFTQPDLMCNRLTIQDWSLPSEMFTTNGLFLCKRHRLEKLGGFNPYLQGWGWDEIDLYSRFFLAGYPVSRITQNGVQPIQHDDELREQCSPDQRRLALPVSKSKFTRLDAAKRMQAQNEKNRQIAVASISKRIGWPSFADYVASFSCIPTLPVLKEIKLFDEREKSLLVSHLVRQLLQPSRLENYRWNLSKRFGKGPYSVVGANSLLDACNIDLSLVS